MEVLQKAYETSVCQNLLNVFKDEVENCREAALDLVFELVVGHSIGLICVEGLTTHGLDWTVRRACYLYDSILFWLCVRGIMAFSHVSLKNVHHRRRRLQTLPRL